MSELYKEAASLLHKLQQRQGGLKSLAYAESTVHKRSSFALVCETLRYTPLIRELLAAVPMCHKALKIRKDAKDPPALVLVALYDLLFGRQKVQGGGYVKKALVQHQTTFRAVLARLKIRYKVATNEALLPPENRQQHLELPRYVRVNTLLASREEIEAFTREYDAKEDGHVRDVLVLPSGTELHEHEMVKSGKLVLQDKASCFPAFVLHGEHSDAKDKQGDVIDACAAPGNKTSHLAMLLQQQEEEEGGGCVQRRVFAFDRSPKRLELLKRRMQLAGAADRVQAELQSFLDVSVDDETYRNVRSILLDPSCSGSGMTNRLDHLLDIAGARDTTLESGDTAEDEDEKTTKRLQSLADFQLEALRKAFSFPQVERVVYSTCSIFEKEDEEVVAAALKSDENVRAARPFVLIPALTSWPRRGLEVAGLSAEQAAALVRADGLKDSTNGFFVAYFERIDTVEGAVDQENGETTKTLTDVSTEVASTSVCTQAEASSVCKKRKVLSATQKQNRKRRKREKRKKHDTLKSNESVIDEEEGGALSLE